MSQKHYDHLSTTCCWSSACCQNNTDPPRNEPLKVSCCIWHQNITCRSFKSCRLWDGVAMNQTCWSNTPHRCSTGLRYGDQSNTLNISCSLHHSWVDFTLMKFHSWFLVIACFPWHNLHCMKGHRNTNYLTRWTTMQINCQLTDMNLTDDLWEVQSRLYRVVHVRVIKRPSLGSP